MRVLAVGAHPDDIELGCGGSIARHIMLSDQVRAVYLTRGEKSNSPEVRVAESRNACRVLGVKDVLFGEFRDTRIPNDHSTIEFLEESARRVKPEIVYTHSVNDSHQDHRTVGYLSLSAFRNIPKILAYETPRVMPNFGPTYFVDISRTVDMKWKALKVHRSQREKRYMTYKSLINLASYRGGQVGVKAAEGFEVVKYLQRQR